MLAAARRLLDLGAGMVAVSRGGGEALLVTREGAWHGRPPRVAACGPVGAGDAMLAGLLAGLLGGDDPGEALRLGLACGAACVVEPETVAPRCRRIRQLLPQVEMTIPMSLPFDWQIEQP
jgi:fructose-1-phosphate kinase PfkB-like protein